MTNRGLLIAMLALSAALPAFAQSSDSKDKDMDVSASCKLLPTHSQLRAALYAARGAANGGFNLDMWGTVVNRDGVVCAVAFTGDDRGDQWPGSRVISAQKANTANAFSLPGLALSTANLYTRRAAGRQPVRAAGEQPGRTRRSPMAATRRTTASSNDPMVGGRIGGVNVFGGGLALYNASGKLVGAHRRQRRLLVRGSQHRLADAQHPEARLRPRGRQPRRARARTTSSTTSPPHPAWPGRQRIWMGPSGLQPSPPPPSPDNCRPSRSAQRSSVSGSHCFVF